ncbi:hypothetical protein UlMin_011705 [Ulmus minor]
MAAGGGVVFEDFFPTMVESLGTEGFMKELCKGFCLLMDEEKGVITFDSLKSKAALLGQGDLNGDGTLNQMEFCTLMFRLSPGLMQTSEELLDEALYHML